MEVVNNGVRTVPVALNRTGPRRSNGLVYMLLVVGTAFEVNAQTTVEPQFRRVHGSVDHHTLATDGTPLVQRYIRRKPYRVAPQCVHLTP